MRKSFKKIVCNTDHASDGISRMIDGTVNITKSNLENANTFEEIQKLDSMPYKSYPRRLEKLIRTCHLSWTKLLVK